MWNKIFNCENFFYSLNPTSYGLELFADIIKISGQIPTILTGVPFGVSKGESKEKKYTQEKINWCKNELLACNDDPHACTDFPISLISNRTTCSVLPGSFLLALPT